MANLHRRIPWQTESLFAENHEAFFNSIDPELPLGTRNCCDAACKAKTFRKMGALMPPKFVIELP
jgi:hypothetical protein